VTTERIDIVVREDGSRVVKRNISEIGEAADGTADALSTMQNIMAALVTGAMLKTLADYTGIWTDLNARVARFAGSAANTEAVMGRIMSIAQRTYAPLESTAEIYLENAFALQELGKSTEQTLDYTEAMTNALVVSGAKGQRAQTVISALSKSMLEGKLRGDNWNTVLTQGGRIVEALTAETGKSLTELKVMASAGQLTSDTVFNALINQLDQLREEADDMPATIGDAFVRMRNRIIQVIGELDQRLGGSQIFVKFIDWVNENLEMIIPTLAGIAAAIVTAFAPGIIANFIGQIRGLWILMAAHPIGAVLAVVAGLTTALSLMRNEIKLGIDDTTTLGDVMEAAWESIGPAITSAMDMAATFFSWLGNTSAGTFAEMIDSLAGYENSSEATWLKLLRIVVRVFDMIGGVVRGTMMGVAAFVAHVIEGIGKNFTALGSAVKSAMAGDIAGAMEQLNSNVNVFEGGGEAFGKAFQAEVLNQDANGLESIMDRWLDRAKEIGAARAAATGEEVDLSGSKAYNPVAEVDKNAIKKAQRELEQLKNSLASVLDAADPVAAATRRLAEAQDVLAKATKAGLITQDAAAQAYANLAEMMEDQLDPLRAINKEIDESIALLKMSNRESEIEQQIMQITHSLRRDGVKLSETELGQLRAKLVVEQELNRIAQIRDQLESDSLSRRSADLSEKIGVAGDMVSSGSITSGDAVRSLSNDIPGLSGTSEALAAQQEQYAAYYAAIDEMRAADLLSETSAMQAKLAIFQEQYAGQFQAASDALGALSTLQRSENKKQAAIGKAAAIAQTIIQTYQSATGAFSAMASIPYVGPFLGAAAAAAAVAAGMANVQAIRSQPVGFRTGGSWTVGGSGGIDSQNVSFRASPGEKIHVNTPAQARALERMGEEREERPRGGVTQIINQNFSSKPDYTTTRQMHRDMKKVALTERNR